MFSLPSRVVRVGRHLFTTGVYSIQKLVSNTMAGATSITTGFLYHRNIISLSKFGDWNLGMDHLTEAGGQLDKLIFRLLSTMGKRRIPSGSDWTSQTLDDVGIRIDICAGPANAPLTIQDLVALHPTTVAVPPFGGAAQAVLNHFAPANPIALTLNTLTPANFDAYVAQVEAYVGDDRYETMFEAAGTSMSATQEGKRNEPEVNSWVRSLFILTSLSRGGHRVRYVMRTIGIAAAVIPVQYMLMPKIDCVSCTAMYSERMKLPLRAGLSDTIAEINVAISRRASNPAIPATQQLVLPPLSSLCCLVLSRRLDIK